MGILRGLRGFAREAGNDPMELAAMDDIVAQCLEIQEARYARHEIELRIKLETELPLLLCREIQIGQIVTNLLNNAFDAIEQAECTARWVELIAVSHGGEMYLDVMDSGPGIDDQFKTHLMEPFFSTKKAGSGMGVGLSLSRAIAQDHGGSLALLARTEHTCFRLVLPVALGRKSTEIREEEVARHATQ
jgi:C4-dicarboxylate-specific signal transduction histidine kinase